MSRRSRSPAAARKSAAAATTTAAAAPAGSTRLSGITPDGRRFLVPDTPTTIEALSHWYSLPSLATFGLCLLSVYAALEPRPKYVILFVAIWWRFAYDGLLGFLLHQQSKTQFLTKWVASVQARPKSVTHRVLSFIIDTTMGEGHNSLADPSLPPEYSAWIVARFIINIILPNDVVAFCVAALSYTDYEHLFDYDPDTCQWDTSICVSPWIIWPIGVFLMITSLYGKVSAHHVIGQFAWFWGDFFFKMDQELTFDGIFELVPHPMYTVGYGWAYAVGLFSRSYTVLALAMASHLAQMLFLYFVETPHIEKLYGAGDSNAESKALGANVLIVRNFDPFRASDVGLILTIFFMLAAVIVGSLDDEGPLNSDAFFIAHAIFWRSAASVTLALVLVRQERTQFWTKHWDEMHSDAHEAFENFKRLMNLLLCLTHTSFLLCAWRLFQLPPLPILFSAPYAARLIFAVMLMGVSHYSFSSSFETLGDFGWYYGDFFLQDKNTVKLSYTGIYRYINNPDVYLGNLWLFAVALVCSSWELFVVAFCAQSAHICFLQLVEKPHLRAIHQNSVRWHSTAVEAKLLAAVKPLGKKVVELAKETKGKVEQLLLQ